MEGLILLVLVPAILLGDLPHVGSSQVRPVSVGPEVVFFVDSGAIGWG